MQSMAGRARLLNGGGALCVLALWLVCVSPTLAAAPPAWEITSSLTPAQIVLTEPVDQEDIVTVSGLGAAPNVGHFALEVENDAGVSVATGPLRENASAIAVQAALEALSTVGDGDVVVTGGPPRGGGQGQLGWSYVVTFVGALAGRQVELTGNEIEASEAEEEMLEGTGGRPEEGYVEVDPRTAGQRDAVRYELVASNVGGSPSSGTITVTDILPAGLTTTTTPQGAGWTCAPEGEAQTKVTCTSEAIVGPGAKTAPITIEAYVDVAGITAGERLVNRVTISGGGASAPAEARDPATAVRLVAPSGQRARSVGRTVIAALLGRQLTPSGGAATVSALLKHGGLTVVFRALEPGAATLAWYQLPTGARRVGEGRRRPVLVAAGRHTFSAAGTAKIRIRLTSAGRRLLEQSKHLTLTANGRFIPTGGVPITATRRFSLKP